MRTCLNHPSEIHSVFAIFCRQCGTRLIEQYVEEPACVSCGYHEATSPYCDQCGKPNPAEHTAELSLVGRG